MKRFWREAAPAPCEGGWTVELDGRPVRTPGRTTLLLPTRALAGALAAEWGAVEERVEPAAMRLTGLANAAIERMGPEREVQAAALAAYAESDVTCYRTDRPADLAAREAEAWDPLLEWAARRYDVAFTPITGVVHHPQPPATVARLHGALGAFGPFELAGLHPVVTVTGSLVIALALKEGVVDPEAAWAAGQLEELYQAERWGEDELAVRARANRRASLEAGARFLALLDEP